MPHCSEILVNQNLASVHYFNPRILIFDKNGMIDNQFVVFDYRTNRKTFSNGGDNILFKTTSNGDSIHVKAALDTMQFASLCKNKNIVFVIGGPYGFDEPKLTPYIDSKIAFGSITLPHGLAKVTLLEQLYRISTIRQGKSYHY